MPSVVSRPSIEPTEPVLPAAAGTLAAAIEDWFRTAARDLPWRRHRTPWRSLVSELMLQQTQVARVETRFEAFMERFPSPRAMAEAGEDAVLGLWEGLGYYRRARLLHAAAVRIVEWHGGEVPGEAGDLLDLPGVGRYTAGSVASIAFGRREPIVDGNVVRVVARLGAVDARADDPALVGAAWSAAADLVAASTDPGRLNEGLMELGATVCTPAKPRCESCPCRSWCRARREGRASEIPRAKIRPTRTRVHLHLVLAMRDGRLAVEQRPRGGLWGGLWQPPGIESSAEADASEVVAVLVDRGLLTTTAATKARLVEVARVRRLLTHREVLLTVSRLADATPRGSGVGIEWHDRDSASGLGMSRPVRTLVDDHAWS